MENSPFSAQHLHVLHYECVSRFPDCLLGAVGILSPPSRYIALDQKWLRIQASQLLALTSATCDHVWRADEVFLIPAVNGRADSHLRCLQITERKLLELLKNDFAIGNGKNVFIALWETAAAESITLIISTSLYAACALISFIDCVVIIRISHLCYFPIILQCRLQQTPSVSSPLASGSFIISLAAR